MIDGWTWKRHLLPCQARTQCFELTKGNRSGRGRNWNKSLGEWWEWLSIFDPKLHWVTCFPISNWHAWRQCSKREKQLYSWCPFSDFWQLILRSCPTMTFRLKGKITIATLPRLLALPLPSLHPQSTPLSVFSGLEIPQKWDPCQNLRSKGTPTICSLDFLSLGAAVTSSNGEKSDKL